MGFLACRIYSEDKKIECRLEQMEIDALSSGEVVIRVAYSGVNYKDALAATGRGKIMKRFPINAGIDLSGVVESSTDDRFSPGDELLIKPVFKSEDILQAIVIARENAAIGIRRTYTAASA